MNNVERETLAIYISMLINGLYFIFMMYVVIQTQKGIYIIDIKAINWYIIFASAITSRIIGTYLDKKYSDDETLRHQAMENSLTLSYLYIFLVIVQRIFYVPVFFIVFDTLGLV